MPDLKKEGAAAMRILLVDDDADLRAAVCAGLAGQGWQVDAAADGEEGLYYLTENLYDVCILDRMLPGLGGLQLLRRARQAGVGTPVLLLTALGSVQHRVEGLDGGADDYLAKPFDLRELYARVRVLARRPAAPAAAGIAFGDLALDPGQLVLRGPGGQCNLSKKEGELLAVLMRNGGQLLPRGLLLARVWGLESEADGACLDSYVHFVRRRLAAVGAGARLATVRGVGYRLEAAP